MITSAGIGNGTPADFKSITTNTAASPYAGRTASTSTALPVATAPGVRFQASGVGEGTVSVTRHLAADTSLRVEAFDRLLLPDERFGRQSHHGRAYRRLERRCDCF